MENTHLLYLIRSLSLQEVREMRKFLASPFFNTRTDLPLLFEYLIKSTDPQKEAAYQRLFPGTNLDAQKLRLSMSYLHKLLEQYLSIKEFEKDAFSTRLHLITAYRRRGLQAPFERTCRKLTKQLEEQPLRHAHFHYVQYRLHWAQTQVSTSDNPTESTPLRATSEALDIYYLSSRLRLICLTAAQQGVYQAEWQTGMEAEILALADREEWRHHPAIAIYLHCYRMLKHSDSESHFQSLKPLLIEASEQFSIEEIRGLYLLAINYCIRQLNDGDKHYFTEVFDLYKSGLTNGSLLENGILSRFTYHNIVAAGLHTGELDWVDHFIHQYKNSLERKYRESSFSFNLARLEYSRKRFDAVLELLQKANYRDPLLNLAAKTLLLKTFFELDEYDLLQSSLDAMRNYIRRKRVIGYHRTNYRNIVRYTEKLLKLNPNDRKALYDLKTKIEAEPVLTERDWLLKHL